MQWTLAKIDDHCAQRDQLKKEEGPHERARAELAMRDQLEWYDNEAAASPWLKALAELRQRVTHEDHCYQHVQAITGAIDLYAEKALGNRDYFLNKPYGVGNLGMVIRRYSLPWTRGGLAKAASAGGLYRSARREVDHPRPASFASLGHQ